VVYSRPVIRLDPSLLLNPLTMPIGPEDIFREQTDRMLVALGLEYKVVTRKAA